MTEAVKYDNGKPELALLPTHAIIGIGKALTYGKKKYTKAGVSGAFNYKKGRGLTWLQISSALLRHLFAWLGGEELDEESGLNHLYHCGACVVMLIDLVDSKKGEDDRFKHEN